MGRSTAPRTELGMASTWSVVRYLQGPSRTEPPGIHLHVEQRQPVPPSGYDQTWQHAIHACILSGDVSIVQAEPKGIFRSSWEDGFKARRMLASCRSSWWSESCEGVWFQYDICRETSRRATSRFEEGRNRRCLGKWKWGRLCRSSAKARNYCRSIVRSGPHYLLSTAQCCFQKCSACEQT